MNIGEFLTTVPLFKYLDEEQLEEIKELVREETFSAGAEIIRQGEASDGLYVIVSGLVQVTGRLDSHGDDEAVLTVLGPGEAFGELALLDGKPRSATVVASWATRCLHIHRSEFVAQLKRHPEIALGLLTVMAERLREADRRIAQLV
ncbi:MAG: cyclic nucleotide-binding domain-containing protein [Chloroflexi bacterium]|nr:cyclic nucleotide-binding domain-containing protein [Chloroflexota bacterium]